MGCCILDFSVAICTTELGTEWVRRTLHLQLAKIAFLALFEEGAQDAGLCQTVLAGSKMASFTGRITLLGQRVE